MKYGMQTSPMPLKIWIKTMIQNRSLRIVLINTGRWITPTIKDNTENGTVSGLENIKKRMIHAYPDGHSINTFEKDGTVHVIVDIKENQKHDIQ